MIKVTITTYEGRHKSDRKTTQEFNLDKNSEAIKQFKAWFDTKYHRVEPPEIPLGDIDNLIRFIATDDDDYGLFDQYGNRVEVASKEIEDEHD